MAGPLAGIRVVELSTFITAPLTGVMLADMGAEVIKVENPDGGDPFRSYGGGNYGAQYCSYNRNKRSIAISLRTDFGRTAMDRLVQRSDVLLDNFRAGVLDRLGLTAARLRELNPSLIHCSITGFGTEGPYSTRPCFDSIAQGLSGMYSQFLDPENPRLTGTTIADNALNHGVGGYNEEAFLKYEPSPDNILRSGFVKNEGGLHPTQKPVRLMQELIELTTQPGQLVLDPFCGSGSTLVAARNTGRQFMGMEMSEEYARIAEQRLVGEMFSQEQFIEQRPKDTKADESQLRIVLTTQ